MNVKRLSSAYIEGKDTNKNPPGFSEFFQGQFVSKGGEECKIHSLTEQVRNDVGLVIYHDNKNHFLDYHGKDLVFWISENIFSYASFAFLCGNTVDHTLKDVDLEILEGKLEIFKNSVTKKSTNFVTYHQKFCLLIDSLRISVRALESAYWSWSEDPRVIAHIRQHMAIDPEGSLIKHQNIVLMGNILNRLSSCLHWVNRVVYEQNFSASDLDLEWSGKINGLKND